MVLGCFARVMTSSKAKSGRKIVGFSARTVHVSKHMSTASTCINHSPCGKPQSSHPSSKQKIHPSNQRTNQPINQPPQPGPRGRHLSTRGRGALGSPSADAHLAERQSLWRGRCAGLHGTMGPRGTKKRGIGSISCNACLAALPMT